MTVSGWGATGQYNSSSAILREVKVPIISNTQCASDLFCSQTRILPSNLCAGVEIDGKDFCAGDIGGPGVFFNSDGRAYHIGLVSWGEGCGLPGSPGVYTRTTHFLDWIEQNTGEKNIFVPTDKWLLPSIFERHMCLKIIRTRDNSG